MPAKRYPDGLIVICTGILLVIGTAMVYSAGAVIAQERFHDTFYFLKRQLLWIALGGIAMRYVMKMDFHDLDTYKNRIFTAVTIMLVLVLLPYFGREAGGAQRWLKLGPVSFQPSEFVKFAVILQFAGMMVRMEENGTLKSFREGFMPLLLRLGIISALIMLQPDMGTVLAIGIAAYLMMFVGGIRLEYLAGTLLVAIPLAIVAIIRAPYRLARYTAWLDPWNDHLGNGFQTIQSFLALGNGYIFGKGLGGSEQKLFYLPEPHTDFIFSILGEELGFVGAGAVIVLFGLLVWRGFRVALLCPSVYGAYLAFGITAMLAVQAFVNIAVTVGLMPVTGIPLPLISQGGSAMVMWLVSIGLLLNISEHVPK